MSCTACSSYFREFAENPWDAITGSDVLGADMTDTRTRMADFVGADPGEILLTHNTTEGMSFTANGLELQEGDEVLTTLHEHSCRACLLGDSEGAKKCDLDPD